MLEEVHRSQHRIGKKTYHIVMDARQAQLEDSIAIQQMRQTLPSGISSVYQSYFKHLKTDLHKELEVTEDQFFGCGCKRAIIATRFCFYLIT